MFRSLQNIPIFRRLLIVLISATVVPVIVIILLGVFYLQAFGTRSQAVQTSFDAQNIATQEQINLQRMNALVQARFAQHFAKNSVEVAGDPSLEASGGLVEADVAAFELDFQANLVTYQQNYEIATSDNMSTIRAILKSDAPNATVATVQQTALNDIANSDPQYQKQDPADRADWNKYENEQTKVLKDLDNNASYEKSYADFYQANLDFLTLKNHWQQVVDAATEMGTTVTQVGPSLINPLIFYITGALIFILLVIIVSSVLVSSTIVIPLNRLVALTRRIARGDTSARAELQGSDEIYQVATSMNGMLDVTVQLMQEAQYRHMDLQSQIEKLIHEVSGLGEGDLRTQAEVTPTELGVLANSFNLMAAQLNNLVVNVKTLARGVQSTTLRTFGYMEQLVDNAETQMQQITKANVEVNNMATSSHQVAERARTLSNVAYEARQVAQRGRTAVQRTVEEMDHITINVHLTTEKVHVLGDRSREINNIVEVISSIAQQTNRLALDAAIQAAMAGDQGTGFGAVAIDIRRLAERAKEQTVMIGRIVKNVLEDINTATLSTQETEREVASGTTLTQEVGHALDSIFSVVERQAKEIEATNQVAAQQMKSTQTVEQIMRQVSEATQQSSTTTYQATEQMKGLAQIAGQLLTSVDIFKLREDRKVSTLENTPTPIAQAKRGFNAPLRGAPAPATIVNGETAFPTPNTYTQRNPANYDTRYQDRVNQEPNTPPEQWG